MKFQIKAYDVIILDYDVKNKILALDSNHIVNVAMWPRLDNSSISVREIIMGVLTHFLITTGTFR